MIATDDLASEPIWKLYMLVQLFMSGVEIAIIYKGATVSSYQVEGNLRVRPETCVQFDWKGCEDL